MFWSDDKELSLRMNAISWNSLKKKKPQYQELASSNTRAAWPVCPKQFIEGMI